MRLFNYCNIVIIGQGYYQLNCSDQVIEPQYLNIGQWPSELLDKLEYLETDANTIMSYLTYSVNLALISKDEGQISTIDQPFFEFIVATESTEELSMRYLVDLLDIDFKKSIFTQRNLTQSQFDDKCRLFHKIGFISSNGYIDEMCKDY